MKDEANNTTEKGLEDYLDVLRDHAPEKLEATQAIVDYGKSIGKTDEEIIKLLVWAATFDMSKYLTK